jgi:hypothetical protein
VSWEELSAISTFVTMIIIGASAIAAVFQLRHMRAGNAITGFLGFMDKWSSPEARVIQTYVFGGDLDRKLADPQYRKSLAVPLVDRLAHPEVGYLDFWESLGMLVKLGYFAEDAFMESGGPTCLRAWEKLMPVVAIIRGVRGPQVYDNFEYLASRAIMWDAKHPSGIFPKSTPHLPVIDVFADDAMGPTRDA